MADIRFEEAKAKAWTVEVQGELEQVNGLLDQVAKECETQPYEDDTIMNSLHKTGVALGEAWKEVAVQFTETINNMFSIISDVAATVGKIVDSLSSYVSGWFN